MRWILLLIFAISLNAQTNGVIEAIKVPGDVSKEGVDSKAWLSSGYSDIWLYPQTTIKMNDEEANKLNEDNKAMMAKVKALYDGKNIAFLLTWRDDTQNVQEGYSSLYADGYAVQLSTSSKADKLPYIGMGSKGRPVLVHLKNATGLIYRTNG